ncbi:MAG: TIGR03936 family radical SAM-associated protein [Eubacteriales bacterium]|nr:TIGR03936 family radical SAM-associated protein [Eubacteriales bacterium]
MPRALFEKTGNARYISHLDLMRVFQRAFKRSSLPLTHTQGFNPRPSVSIALPLSLGVESKCELLDFELESPHACEEIREKLNAALIDGVSIREVYEQGQKIKNLALLQSRLVLEYDNPLPDDAVARIQSLFSRPELVVEKKGKNGVTHQDIIPMLRRLTVNRLGNREVEITALHSCQNPSLNPMQLSAAITKYLPELAPDYVRCFREEIFDTNETIFR